MLFKNGDLTLFQDQAYLALTTFRRNGAPVATPVWFAQEDQRLYIMTGADTGKVRRIRNNAQVEVAPAPSAAACLVLRWKRWHACSTTTKKSTPTRCSTANTAGRSVSMT